MDAFNEFHEHVMFTTSTNSTFVVLILKKGGVKNLDDFRLISLVGSFYKILAKVLSNRLKRVVEKVVSKAQNAFVGCCQILDATLVANKIDRG